MNINPVAVFAARFINSRLTPELRNSLSAHAGSVIALQAGVLQLCFRLDNGGRWQAASSLVHADAEMRLAESGDDFEIRGSGALLSALDEVRQRCAPDVLLTEIFGANGAQCLQSAAREMQTAIQNLPVECNLAPSAGECADFIRRTVEFDQELSALSRRLSHLEGRHG